MSLVILDDLEFGRGRNGEVCLGKGWHNPDDEFVWAAHHVSVLDFTPSSEHAAYVVVLNVRPAFDPIRVTLWCHGHFLGRYLVAEKVDLVTSVPASLVVDGKVSITIHHFQRRKVSDVHKDSDDDRMLSMALDAAQFFGTSMVPDLMEPTDRAAREVAAMTPGQVMARFQSLGDNCEFGIAQRGYGIEPLGLLRFAGIGLSMVLLGLSIGFEGLTAPDLLSLYHDANTPETSDVIVKHKLYGLNQHTFVTGENVDMVKLLMRTRVKLDGEKRMFLDDLEDAEKIFVIKRNDGFDIADVLPLWSLLRSYGNNTLLYVVLAKGDNLPGTVERKAPGLYCGYMDAFASYEEAFNISDDCWLSVCRSALRVQMNENVFSRLSQSTGRDRKSA